jgi:hypothetical protein
MQCSVSRFEFSRKSRHPFGVRFGLLAEHTSSAALPKIDLPPTLRVLSKAWRQCTVARSPKAPQSQQSPLTQREAAASQLMCSIDPN